MWCEYQVTRESVASGEPGDEFSLPAGVGREDVADAERFAYLGFLLKVNKAYRL